MGDLGLGVCVRPNADHFMYVCSREDGKKPKKRGKRKQDKGKRRRGKNARQNEVRGAWEPI